MIYLTDYRTASTTQTHMIEDILYPQRVHWFADTYAKKDTGLVYAPHKLAERVLDKALMADLKKPRWKDSIYFSCWQPTFRRDQSQRSRAK